MGGRGLAWLWGFGGVRIDGKPVWPVKILGESVDDVEPRFKAKVLKAKRAGTTLVFTYGDDKYVWAKPKWLQPLKIRDARAALEHVSDGELIEAAIRAAIGVGQQSAPPPPPPVTQPPPSSVTTPNTKAPTPNPEGLSAYELQRLENIQANQRALEALGIVRSSEALGLLRTPQKLDPEAKAQRARERHERMLEAQANRRQSSRLAEQPEGGAPKAKRYVDELEELDREERAEAAARELARKRQRLAAKQGGSGGRGSRKAAQDSLLSAEQRAAIAEAYDEASGWLDEMRRHFTDKLSEPNLRNVMKQVTRLATGEGIPHTFNGTFFRRGEPVTLDEDLVALRAAANRFLLPEDDPGHGWRLDHPIGKLGLFQTYLHAKQRK